MTKAPVNLQDLRRRIYVKAKTEPSWRFWGLYVHVCKTEVLHAAYGLAKENNGAPGIDGVTFEAVEAVGVDFTVQLDEWLNDLRRAAEEYSDAVDILYRFQTTKEGRFHLGDQAKPRPPELNIDHLKPTKAAVGEIKERLDGNLGAEWFEEASGYLRTKTVEEEGSGADS